MANTNTPWGLRPVKSLIAGDWDGRGNVYHILSTDATYSYHVGDLVQLSGTGDANGVPGVTKYTPNDGVTLGTGACGVIVGIGVNPGGPYVNPSNLDAVYAPQVKSSDYYCLVADDPFLIFEVQEGGSGTALAATAIGNNCNLSYTAAHTGRISTTILDNSTEATTIGLDVHLMRLAPTPGNAFGYYAKWHVMINNHAFKAGFTGV